MANVYQTVGSNANLTANITTISGGKIGSGQAEFYMDDVKIATVNVKLGVASYVYSISSSASNKLHTIKVVYLGTNDYAPSNGTGNFGIQSISEISLNNITGTIGKAVTINATIKSGNKNINSGYVDIYIGNVFIYKKNIVNGQITYQYTIPYSFDKGNYNLKIVYNGTGVLSPAEKVSKITINPATPVFSFNKTTVAVGTQANLLLKIDNGLTGSNYYGADSGKVTVKLNGKLLTDANGNNITGTVRNGSLTLKFNVPSELKGNNNITFIYGGNSKFTSYTKTYINYLVIVNLKKTNIQLYNSYIGTKGSNATLNGKLLSNGTGVKGVTVTVTVNNKNYTATTLSSGYFQVNYTVTNYNSQNVKFTFAGNSNYEACSNSTTLKIKQPTTITTYNIATAKVGSTIKIGAKLLSNNTGVKNQNVIIKINGKSYSATTFSSGYFAINYTVTTAGTNNITYTYNGASLYLPVETTQQFTSTT